KSVQELFLHRRMLLCRYGIARLEILIDLQGTTHVFCVFGAKFNNGTCHLGMACIVLHPMKQQANIVWACGSIEPALGFNLIMPPPLAGPFPTGTARFVKAQEKWFAALSKPCMPVDQGNAFNARQVPVNDGFQCPVRPFALGTTIMNAISMCILSFGDDID